MGAAGLQPFIENLEARRLLAIAINEFGGSATLSNPAGITLGPDGNLWYTESSATAGAIDQITPSGAITQFSSGLSSGAAPIGIASGSDGALWFTEPGSDQIGRIDTSGNINQFNIPTPNGSPDQIVSGSDGALWFTETAGERIGRIDTTGVITEFVVPTANSVPTGITTGPDGALWFTESNTSKIGRITTAGVFAEFSAGIAPNSVPTGITTGPDGALWFTETGADSIGRITTSGRITQFSTGISPGGGPNGMSAGPDGNVWFTEENNGLVGQITPQGVVTEFSGTGVVPTAGLDGITAGPDGNLWYTELDGNHVDRISSSGMSGQFPSSTNVITPEATPLGITQGPATSGTGNALWFTENSANKIGEIDTAGNITEFANGISQGAAPFGITADATGNLWFTEAGLAQIGEITPQGVVTEFGGLTSGSDPQGITLGPDGNLYFAENGVDGTNPAGIGMITPQGVVTEFRTGLTSGAAPSSIAVGPDGALWFTEKTQTGGAIGRIAVPTPLAPNPVITQFTIPNNTSSGFRSNPGGIVKGKNNDLWFTDAGNHAIGRITTTGLIQEFHQGLNNSDLPAQITLASDGNYWFTDPVIGGDPVGRITPQGVITLFGVPSDNGGLFGIADGPDGNIWFAEALGNLIGQAVLAQSITSPIASNPSPVATVPSLFEVATFVDSQATNGANFAASINFGDGTTGPGTIIPLFSTGNSTTYEVLGSHTYTQVNQFQIALTLSTATGFLPPLTFLINSTSAISVSGAPIDGISGTRANTQVGILTVQGDTATASDFNGTIDWGDGTSSAANFELIASTGSTETFGIYGGHTYTNTGTFNTSLTIVDTRSNDSEFGSSTADIVAAAPSRIFNEFGPNSLTPGAGATGIAVGSDGALWFTETNSGAIGRVDTSGNVTEFGPTTVPGNGNSSGTFSAASKPTGITSGPGGALWFTESALDQIGRVTTGGVFGEFSSGITPGSDPTSIVTGPDGNLWFTEELGNRIGRITPGGVVTEFSTGLTSGFDPDSITLGSDGNLWFVGLGSNLIGRITTSGVITEFSGATGSGLSSITSVPNGSLWFTEQGSNQIGEIDPTTFQVTEFTDPNLSGPTSITSVLDGNLWFTETATGAVGRITPAGVVTIFATGLTTAGRPAGIVAGPDGNLYFTETAGDRIGQAILPQLSVVAAPVSPLANGTQGVPYNATLATFTDSSPAANVANFLANIDYGDGTGLQLGTVQSDGNGGFLVLGSHTYSLAGNYTIAIAVFNDADAATPVSDTLTITAAVPQANGLNVDAIAGLRASTNVARFNSTDPNGVFTATIDWGDGSGLTSGLVQAFPSASGFGVYGGHIYSLPGPYTVTVTVRDVTNTTMARVTSTATVVAPAAQSVYNEVAPPALVPGSGPYAITLGPDGDLWFTNRLNGSIGTVTTSGVVTEFTTGLPTNGLPSGIVTGPGPNFDLWFTEPGTSEIGRITTAGVVSFFSAGLLPGSQPTSITLGPDNNLWFTDPGANAIGEITPSGVITEFTAGITSGSVLGGITPGSDHNLWFTEEMGDKIGRITTAGVVTEFSTGLTPNGFLVGITSGSDHNLWFTDTHNNQIGRITPTATPVITEFSAGLTGAPYQIAGGPDGNLWFTETLGGLVGRITTAGAITEFPVGLTANGNPSGITSGPDGNLYFAESFGDRIGQVVLPQTSVVTSTSTIPDQTKGVSFTVSVATFTDNSSLANLTNFQAAIDWGDGSSSSGTVTLRNGIFTIAGTHTYANFGTFTGTATISNATGFIPVTFTIDVPNPVTLTVTGIDVAAQATRPFTAPVASFTDSAALPGQRSYQATIDWGDGTSSAGTIARQTDGSFLVSGTHTYATARVDTITTTVQVIGIPNDFASATSRANVTSLVSVLSAVGANVYATLNNPITTIAANFTDSSTPTPGTAPSYTAAINWGDGTPPSVGTVVPVTQGIYQVFGTHTYILLGHFSVAVAIRKVGTPDAASTTSFALVEVPGPIDEVKTVNSANAANIAAGPDGALWFTEPQVDAIGRITTGGVVTSFTSGISSGSRPNVITSGPDGALWFTETDNPAIGRITTAGVVTEFTQGLPSTAMPTGITSGPDGNLWFTDPGDDAIGRITPQGVVTEFTQGLVGGLPAAITNGPDGALWFTVDDGPGTGSIGRITTQGIIIEFPLSTPNAGLTSIVTGPDGALWFTEFLAGKIGSITTSGVVTEFTNGLTADSRPSGITTGPDGNLWFVDLATNHVDRITTSGVITTFAIPTSSSNPLDIVTGSDDNLWFTETTAGQIGQIVLPQSVVSTGSTFTVAVGQPLTAAFATLTDKSSLVDLTRFFAPTIAFGDGTFGTGTLASDGAGGFTLTATHTYPTAGTFATAVTIANVVGTTLPATSVVNVTGPIVPVSFVVTNTNDSGPGSLRQAILYADLFPGHTITFAIPADGVATISLLSALPDINGLTVIDGRSQAAFEGSASTQPLVEVDGRAVGGSSPGLLFDGSSGGSTVDGLAIYGFAGPQIELASPGDYVFDSYIGLRANGYIPAPLSGGPTVSASATVAGAGDGVLVLAANAIIGTFLPGQGNVISGNAGQGIEISGPQTTSVGVFGNLIGLDPTGQAARGNALNGILVTGGAGFEFIGPRNVISGNANDGISLLGSRSVWISGNFIGTNLTANRAIGNGVDGVSLDLGSMDVTIGGLTPGATNIISGNGSTGIALRAGSDHNFIQADLIGTNLPGDAAIGNGIAGVLISDSSSNVIGPRDLISGNGTVSQGAGVWIDGAAATNNLVIGDRIGTDLAGEAAIPNSVIGVLINDGSANSVGDGSFGDGNQVSGNSLIGVMIAGTSASANLIAGNLIGTDATGTKPLANGSTNNGAGVYIDGSPGNFVGGTTASLGNVISGNGFDGVQIFGATAAGNLFQGNRIGTDISGALPLGNGDDGLVVNDAPGTRIVGNIIAANLVNGILLTGAGASGTLIQGNAIGRGIGGQALGNGGFGVLIINGVPEPTLVANVNVNNTLGPIRDTNATPAGTTATAKSSKKVKVVHKKSAKVKPMASRPLEAFHAKSHPKKK